jgi:ABC-2 type transport system permease protein
MVFARNVSDIAKLIIIPQAFNCLMAQVGLYVNLHLPKLDWISDLQPVKQGASAMFVMFGAMALIFGLSLLYLLVFIELSLDYYLWALTLIALILNVTLYRYFSGERAAERFLSL